MWYGAYLLITSEAHDNDDCEIIAEEPVYLLEANSMEEAEEKAIGIAKKIAGTGISFSNHTNSNNVSYGFRKIVEISNPELGNDTRPYSGSEIVYQILKFARKSDFDQYRKNISIHAELIEKIE